MRGTPRKSGGLLPNRYPDPSALDELDRILPLAAALAPGRDCQVHDVRWTPGERCRVALRGPLRAGAPTGFVAVEAGPDGLVRHDYRADPALPGLARAADATTVAALLGEAIGETIRACEVEPVRYRPGSRCVLRYDVITDAGITRFYAKAFAGVEADGRAARVEAIANVAAALATAGRADGRVDGRPALAPPITAVWPDLGVIVTPSAGCSASSVLARPGLAPRDRVVLARHIGALLARLHAAEAPGVPTGSTDAALAGVDATCVAARHADPALAQRLDAALDRLRAAQPEPERMVLSHCGFRFGQVASSTSTASGRLTLLDLDNAAVADPARDVANALAHLSWRQIRTGGDDQELAALTQGFRAGYLARGARLDEAALTWWRALSLVQLAARRYRRLELADWPSLPAVLTELERLLPAPRAHRSRRVDLADLARMTAELRAATGVPALEITSSEPLSEAPGRRTVVRYRVGGLDPAGPVELVAKAFLDPARAATADANLSALAGRPFAAGELRVPEPVALVDDRVLVYRSADGVPLARLTSGSAAVPAARSAARWLARLHSCGIELPRHLNLAAEASSAHQWAALIGANEPTLATPATALAQRWALEVTAGGAGGAGASVPLHKDFHVGHVLVDAARVTVIDLDEMRLGEPTFDVAHFCTYLDLLPQPWAADARVAFLSEYAAVAGWPATAPSTKRAMAVFGAYTCLKIAKQLSVGSGPLQVPSQATRDTAARVLRKGLACLDR